MFGTGCIMYSTPRLNPACSKPISICDSASRCENGLSFCEVCKGGEGDIPTDCPGKPLNEHQISYIVNEALDFIDGKWYYKTKAYGEM